MTKRIVADSSANFYSDESGIYTTVPLKVTVEGNEYIDTEGADIEKMITDIERSTNSSTSCPSIGEWMEAFEGADEIYAITISSNLSGSYNAACTAKQHYLEEHPEAKIHVIDSLSTAGEMRLCIEKIETMIAEGKTFEEIVPAVDEYHSHIHLLFVLETLQNLAKNGRVSPALAKVAGLFGISFVGKASEDGTIKQAAIAKGRNRMTKTVVAEMQKFGYNGGKVWISHVLTEENAGKLTERIHEAYPDAEVCIDECGVLCSYYAQRSGMIIGFECE